MSRENAARWHLNKSIQPINDLRLLTALAFTLEASPFTLAASTTCVVTTESTEVSLAFGDASSSLPFAFLGDRLRLRLCRRGGVLLDLRRDGVRDLRRGLLERRRGLLGRRLKRSRDRSRIERSLHRS